MEMRGAEVKIVMKIVNTPLAIARGVLAIKGMPKITQANAMKAWPPVSPIRISRYLSVTMPRE